MLAAAFLLPGMDGWVVEWLRYLPYPLFLGMAGCALLLALWMPWRWRLLALSALLAVLGPVMGAVVDGHPEGGSIPLRVMSFNTKSYLATSAPDGFGRIAVEITMHNPDVLVMQDAQSIDDVDVAVGASVRPELKRLLGGRAAHVHGELVIASRYPLRDCRSMVLGSGRASASALRCTLQVQGAEVDVLTTHFLSPRKGLNATRSSWLAGWQAWAANFESRLTQSLALAGHLAARQRPLILAGDLNAPEHSPVLRALLATGLRDAFSAAGQGYGYTVGHSLRPGIGLLRIDHVLTSPEIAIERCEVGSADASEHRPVVADLWLKRE